MADHTATDAIAARIAAAVATVSHPCVARRPADVRELAQAERHLPLRRRSDGDGQQALPQQHQTHLFAEAPIAIRTPSSCVR